jgi:hypothetical protein
MLHAEMPHIAERHRRSGWLLRFRHAGSLPAGHPGRYNMWSTPRLSLDRGIATSANGAAVQGVTSPGGGPACEGSAPAPNQHRAERRAVLQGQRGRRSRSLASDLENPIIGRTS